MPKVDANLLNKINEGFKKRHDPFAREWIQPTTTEPIWETSGSGVNYQVSSVGNASNYYSADTVRR